MMDKIRQYLTPMVATLAVAVLGATAFAVAPDLAGEPTGRASETGDSAEEDLVEPSPSPGPEDEEFESTLEDELQIDPIDITDPATPSVIANEKPNHGHFVSCIARMAKTDSTLEGRAKGAVVSFAARQKDAVLPRGADCSAAYAAAKAGAAANPKGPARTEQTEGESDSVDETQKSGAVNSHGPANKAKQAPEGRGSQPPAGAGQQNRGKGPKA